MRIHPLQDELGDLSEGEDVIGESLLGMWVEGGVVSLSTVGCQLRWSAEREADTKLTVAIPVTSLPFLVCTSRRQKST